MWGRLRGWVRQTLWKAAVPTVVVPPPVHAVLGVTTEPSRAVPVLTGRRIRFKELEWVQRDGPDRQGLVTFVRDIVVNGRVVQSELQVHEADLTQLPDGTWALHGRP